MSNLPVTHLSTCFVHLEGACSCGAESRRTEAEARAAIPVRLEDQIKCLRREIALRKNVYPKWVENKRMKQSEADRELAAMQAAHDTLTQAVDILKALVFSNADTANVEAAYAGARKLMREIGII